MTDILEIILSKYNYWIYITLMMIGLYAMIAKNNMVKKIVGSHRGLIDVDSAPGKGAEFLVRLPMVQQVSEV